MVTFLIVFHVIVCILLVVTVLLQFGKGAEMGAIMGGGASQAVFSSSAKGNFMTKTTTVLAILFMVNSIVLTIIKSKAANRSLFDNEAPIAAPLNSDMEGLGTEQGMEGAPAGATERVTPETAPLEPTAPVPATRN
jgi:preprotein translocase subunit SecG